MQNKSNIWALVLAAGDGKRLERLTTANGGRATQATAILHPDTVITRSN
jgi:hypothetical protein